MKKLILILALILNLNPAGAYECSIYYPADWKSPTDIKQLEGRIQVLFATPGRAVAYENSQGDLVVSQNQWSRTTASHLTLVDKGAVEDRIPYEEFKRSLKREIEKELKYD